MPFPEIVMPVRPRQRRRTVVISESLEKVPEIGQVG
jgi:hypothetical protein